LYFQTIAPMKTQPLLIFDTFSRINACIGFVTNFFFNLKKKNHYTIKNRKNNVPTVHFFNIILILLFSGYLSAQDYSLQFLASGSDTNQDVDRVVIPLDNPERPVDVALDFTIEFWMKAFPGDNTANACGRNEWYYGNVIVDRDVFGDGDFGDYGIVLCNRAIVVGVQRGNLGHGGVVGNTLVDDGQWHHIAVTRQASSGGVWLYVDGVLDASSNSSASNGNISYRNGRVTSYQDDPTLVFGAEKHDYPGSLYYKGKLDEFRLSNTIRYSSNFAPPSSPFTTDSNTLALYHFDEGNGAILTDVSGAIGGPSNGNILYGGTPTGPRWSYDTPFHPALEVISNENSGVGSLRQIIADALPESTIVFSPYLHNQIIDITSPLLIDKPLYIKDLNFQPITVQTNEEGPVFSITPTSSLIVLRSFKIKSGNGADARAIHNQGTLRLEDMMIEDISPGSGSCILNTGNLEIIGSVIVD